MRFMEKKFFISLVSLFISHIADSSLFTFRYILEAALGLWFALPLPELENIQNYTLPSGNWTQNRRFYRRTLRPVRHDGLSEFFNHQTKLKSYTQLWHDRISYCEVYLRTLYILYMNSCLLATIQATVWIPHVPVMVRVRYALWGLGTLVM